MDLFTFTVEIIKALAWPLVTLAVALIFRMQLRLLLGRIKKGKVGPAEFEFEESVKALRDEAAELTDKEPPKLPPTTLKHLESNPRDAILAAWLEVEQSIRRLLEVKGFATHATASPLRSIQKAQSLGIVDQIYIDLANELRHLRNRATHEIDFNPSPESVIDYVRLSRELADVFGRAAER